MIHYIYRIVNRINGKKYVGYTSRVDPVDRWKAHITASTQPDKQHRPFYRAIRKYGVDQFNFELLYCSVESDHTLSVMENHFIIEQDSFISENGYNLTMGGESNFGWVPTDETRKLWSSQRKGRTLSESHKNNISKGGKKRYQDHPEWKEFHRQLAIKDKRRPPKSTPESARKSAITRTGGHIHTEEHKEALQEKFKDNNPFLSQEAIEKKKEIWRENGRGLGAKNGNAVFGKVYNPDGDLVGNGFLKELCDRLDLPFKTFLAASRHGNKLQRGKWKGWKIVRATKIVDITSP